MDETANIGELDRTLLIALLQCGGHAYGIEIQREVAERTGRTLSPGAIYTALGRLERKHLVRSDLGEPTAVRGGRRKRYYQVSAAGEQALQRSLDELRSLTRGLAPRFRSS